MSESNLLPVHLVDIDIFPWTSEIAEGTERKVTASPKSLGLICLGHWICVLNFMAITNINLILVLMEKIYRMIYERAPLCL